MPAEDVSAVILEARAAGYTFREIAEVVGVSASTIHRLARGGAMVDPATQRALEGLELFSGVEAT